LKAVLQEHSFRPRVSTGINPEYLSQKEHFLSFPEWLSAI